jgi:hypothetical protein
MPSVAADQKPHPAVAKINNVGDRGVLNPMAKA